MPDQLVCINCWRWWDGRTVCPNCNVALVDPVTGRAVAAPAGPAPAAEAGSSEAHPAGPIPSVPIAAGSDLVDQLPAVSGYPTGTPVEAPTRLEMHHFLTDNLRGAGLSPGSLHSRMNPSGPGAPRTGDDPLAIRRAGAAPTPPSDSPPPPTAPPSLPSPLGEPGPAAMGLPTWGTRPFGSGPAPQVAPASPGGQPAPAPPETPAWGTRAPGGGPAPQVAAAFTTPPAPAPPGTPPWGTPLPVAPPAPPLAYDAAPSSSWQPGVPLGRPTGSAPPVGGGSIPPSPPTPPHPPFRPLGPPAGPPMPPASPPPPAVPGIPPAGAAMPPIGSDLLPAAPPLRAAAPAVPLGAPAASSRWAETPPRPLPAPQPATLPPPPAFSPRPAPQPATLPPPPTFSLRPAPDAPPAGWADRIAAFPVSGPALPAPPPSSPWVQPLPEVSTAQTELRPSRSPLTSGVDAGYVFSPVTPTAVPRPVAPPARAPEEFVFDSTIPPAIALAPAIPPPSVAPARPVAATAAEPSPSEEPAGAASRPGGPGLLGASILGLVVGLMVAALWVAAAISTQKLLAPLAIVVGVAGGLVVRRSNRAGGLGAALSAALIGLVAIGLGLLAAALAVYSNAQGVTFLTALQHLQSSLLSPLETQIGTQGAAVAAAGVVIAALVTWPRRKPSA